MSIRAVLRYFKGEWPTLVGASVVAAVGAVFDALSVVLIVGLADAVSREAPRLDQSVGPLQLSMSLGATAAAAALSIVLSVVALLGLSQLRARAVTRWTTVRRLALVDAFINADWDIQARDRAGTLQSELSYVGYASSLLGALVNVSRGVIGLAILVGTAFVFNIAAALLIMLLGVTISAVLRPINRSVKTRSTEQAVHARRVNEELGELSQLARDIRVFGVQGEFRKRVSAPIRALGDAERRLGILAGVVTPIYQAMALSLIVGGLYASSRFTSVDAGLLGIIALLMLRSISYGQQLQGAITTINQALPALDIIDTSLARLEASRPSLGTLPLDRVSTIELDEIHFSYGDDGPVLMGISNRFCQGEIVGLIGRSGSGKTTMAQILLRLRNPVRGGFLVNGEPAETYDSSAWTRRVSFVPQETHLLHGSIHDNIAMLRPWIRREEVEQAAVAAGIHDTICSLPRGYDSVVGSGARDLSGGQRQRIGIARALVGRPSVIVLDEPTSALDQRSESTVQDALAALKGNALVIVIAHRLSTLAICDRVILLADGRIEREMPPHLVEAALGDSALVNDDSGSPAPTRASHPLSP